MAHRDDSSDPSRRLEAVNSPELEEGAGQAGQGTGLV
jgi:hypothetical protein